jgi:hypothetical protein
MPGVPFPAYNGEKYLAKGQAMQPIEETARPGRFPWGLVILLALQSTVWVLLYRNQVMTEAPAAMPVLATMVATGMVVFLLVRGLQNGLWGLAAAFFLVLHPVYAIAVAGANSPHLWTVFVELLALMCVLGIWYHAFQPKLHLLALFAFVLVLLLASSLAWLTSPHSGWVTMLLAGSGLLLAAVLTGLTPGPATRSARVVHGLLTGMFAIAIPVGCLLLAAPFLHATQWLSQNGLEGIQEVLVRPGLETGATVDGMIEDALQPELSSGLVPGFTLEELSEWAWPQFVVVAVLMALGFYRSMRRGWQVWRKGHPPLPWVLTLFSLSVLTAGVLHPDSVRQTSYLPLVSLSVLLMVFGVGDTLWSLGEAIQLAPPGEQEESALS